MAQVLNRDMKPKGRSIGDRARCWIKRSNKGQAIVLIALVFVALIALVGLVVDVGVVLTRYAQLRRAVDAAGIQATNQFREGRKVYTGSGGDMYSSTAQMFGTQMGQDAKLRVYACIEASSAADILDLRINSSPPNGIPDPTDDLKTQLCTDPRRKLVRVDGQVDVGLPFLSVIGMRSFPLTATSVAEAASLDLIIVLDRSSSMAPGSDPSACAPKSCQPFEQVRSNAIDLVKRLYFPYDHVALVEFDRNAYVFDPMAGAFISATVDSDFTKTPLFISDQDTAVNALNDEFSIQMTCEEVTGIPGSCTNTNIGGAIRTATTLLAVQGRLQNAVWSMVFLTDGSPNATDPVKAFTSGYCPPMTWQIGGVYSVPGYINGTAAQPPYANSLCLRLNHDYTNHVDLPYSQIQRACIYTNTTSICTGPGTNIYDQYGSGHKYDPVDYARDQADYMASNGIVAFVIGLGNLVNQANNTCSGCEAIDPAPRDPRAGERVLRYIADVGSQPNLWLCHSNYWDSAAELNAGVQCGNYWYAATGEGLKPVFEAIASRIFTRLTQ